MFFEDAVFISNLLEITLTSKDAGKDIGKITYGRSPSSCNGEILRRIN